MPSSWPVSNGGYLAHLSIEYCYVATISGFAGLEAVGPPAPHNTQKVGKTKLRNVGMVDDLETKRALPNVRATPLAGSGGGEHREREARLCLMRTPLVHILEAGKGR